MYNNKFNSYLPIFEHCGASVHTAARWKTCRTDGEGFNGCTGSGGSEFFHAA